MKLPIYVLAGATVALISFGFGLSALVASSLFAVFWYRSKCSSSPAPAVRTLEKTPFQVHWTPCDAEAKSAAVSLQSHDISTVPPQLFSFAKHLFVTSGRALVSLDLSRNKLEAIPPAIGELQALTELDLSRNQILIVPPELGMLCELRKLNLLSNSLRPVSRSLPLKELSGLLKLKVLDLRFNKKIKGPATKLQDRLPQPGLTVLVTTPRPKKTGGAARGIVGAHACDRDAGLLRSQLEPISTPQLRKRLTREFRQPTDPEQVDREAVMRQLLAAYAARAKQLGLKDGQLRLLRHVSNAGTPVREDLLRTLHDELRSTQWRSGTARERPTVRARGYIILRSPSEFATTHSAKAKLAAKKLQRHARLWELAGRAIQEADPVFATLYTAVAVTKNFEGSPHIDTQNIGPFCGLSLGEFARGTGGICVECSAHEVAQVDTKGRIVKVDGRFPHWVAPYQGERYSVIYYQTIGQVTQQTAAFFL